MAKEAVKFVLRLQPRLHVAVKKMAKSDGTSMNHIISEMIRAQVKPENTMVHAIRDLEKRLVEKDHI